MFTINARRKGVAEVNCRTWLEKQETNKQELNIIFEKSKGLGSFAEFIQVSRVRMDKPLVIKKKKVYDSHGSRGDAQRSLAEF